MTTLEFFNLAMTFFNFGFLVAVLLALYWKKL